MLDDAGRAVKDIGETTRQELQAILVRAHKEGLSIPATADFIRMSMRDQSRARATTIARRETIRLVNAGAVATMRSVASATGDEFRKVWHTASGAEHPRHAEYANLNGQTVALGATFDVGGHRADHPGDPSLPPSESVNCRCAISFQVPEEE